SFGSKQLCSASCLFTESEVQRCSEVQFYSSPCVVQN
ncbi:unnamed protein product, partial [Allacma fusca]